MLLRGWVKLPRRQHLSWGLERLVGVLHTEKRKQRLLWVEETLPLFTRAVRPVSASAVSFARGEAGLQEASRPLPSQSEKP